MKSSKIRDFLAKLDPRPQTIGLFVSHSGIDNGAKSAIRRSNNTKTVIVFEKGDIECILLHGGDLGGIFSEKLRDFYDYMLEPKR